MSTESEEQIATLAGGCFWCLQPIFDELRGVNKVEVGYSGGHVPNPTYRLVCTDTTGHAEAVQVTFDPTMITFGDVLRVFFSVHDPTTLNSQGPDFGSQYRSAIFYHTPEQKAEAQRVIEDFEKAQLWEDPIVTEIAPLKTFYRAEEYHQDYFRKNPTAGYCRAVVAPKVAKFRKEFAQSLRKVSAQQE